MIKEKKVKTLKNGRGRHKWRSSIILINITCLGLEPPTLRTQTHRTNYFTNEVDKEVGT